MPMPPSSRPWRMRRRISVISASVATLSIQRLSLELRPMKPSSASGSMPIIAAMRAKTQLAAVP